MKKSWIIVLAFVCLWSAVPAFSTPLPVPSELCLQVSDYEGENIRLILNSEGMIGNVEYFRVSGSYVWDEGAELLTGSAHRKSRRALHFGFTGTYDEGGPGAGYDTTLEGYDMRYNLKKGQGVWSIVYIWDEGTHESTATLTAVDCSTLDEPPW